MIKEYKELLKDLSGRIPYGVMLRIAGHDVNLTAYNTWIYFGATEEAKEHIKPYLRPMSSMTKEECTQLNVLLPRYFIVTPECLNCLEHINGGIINFEVLDTIIDFYNSHHLDWRGLINKGLAIEAPKDMYKF